MLTDAKARQSGFTAGRGPISEVGGSYNSGGGVLKLVIVPLLSSSYELDLIGIGEGPVLFGAAAFTSTGALIVTGYRGGENVYRYGVGVSAASVAP